jgi:hypothetical protein
MSLPAGEWRNPGTWLMTAFKKYNILQNCSYLRMKYTYKYFELIILLEKYNYPFQIH